MAVVTSTVLSLALFCFQLLKIFGVLPFFFSFDETKFQLRLHVQFDIRYKGEQAFSSVCGLSTADSSGWADLCEFALMLV